MKFKALVDALKFAAVAPKGVLQSAADCGMATFLHGRKGFHRPTFFKVTWMILFCPGRSVTSIFFRLCDLALTARS